MIRQEISTGQLLERIRDLRSQVTGFTQRITLPVPPESKISKSAAFESPAPQFKSPVQPSNVNVFKEIEPVLAQIESPPPVKSAPTPVTEGKPLPWAKTRLVESGLALTGELKTWQVRAESGNTDIATILDPEEFRAVVRVADAALRLIPAFPTEPELLEPLALALETILQPLRQKIASWHQVAREFAELGQLVRVAKTASDPGQKSALAATLVRFSQKTGRLGLWLLPWDQMQPSERMSLAEAWLASTEAFKGGVWAMHEAAFGALQGKAPPIPPLWGSWLADLETGEKPSGPWSLCQSIGREVGEAHPLAGEWIPVEHPGLGVLLLIGIGEKEQSCRGLRWGTNSETEANGTTIVLTPQDKSVIRDLPQARLRSQLAKMLLGGSRS